MRFFYTLILLTITVQLYSQEKSIKNAVLDTMIIKLTKYLNLDDTTVKITPTIRIIDISNSFFEDGTLMYRNFNIQYRKSLPLNLNNGQYRDIIITKYFYESNYILVDAIAQGAIESVDGFHVPYYFQYKFIVSNTSVFLDKLEVQDLANWNGNPPK